MALQSLVTRTTTVIQRGQRQLAAYIQFLLSVAGRFMEPIGTRLSRTQNGYIQPPINRIYQELRIGRRRLERYLAANVPRIPAPTITLPRIGVVPPRHIGGVLGFAGLLTVPVFLTAFQLSELILPVYLMIFAMSWDFVSGYTGQVSLGHSVFFALGGYTTTVLNLQHGVSPLLSIPMGAVVAGVGGFIIGYPALRIRGPYLSLLTLIAPLILLQLVILFNNTLPYVAPSGLGGVNGFVSTNDPLVGTGPEAVLTVTTFPWAVIFDYYLAILLFVGIFVVLYAITRSNTGTVFTAIRENEDTVVAVGLNAAKFKLFAFVVSGIIGGLAGATFVHSSIGNPLDPQQILVVAVSIDIVIMAIIGGMGTIVGAAVGAVFFVGASYLIESLGNALVIPILDETLATYMPAPLLIAALLVVVFWPRGLVPAALKLGRWLSTPPSERPTQKVTDEHTTPIGQILEEFRDILKR